MKKNKVHFVILCGLMAGTLFGAEAPIQSQKKTFSECFQAEKKVWQNGIAAAKKRHIQKKALNKQELRAYNAVLKRLGGGLAALLAAIGVISFKVKQKRRAEQAERERQAERLFAAIDAGNLDGVLLGAGADVNVADHFGKTPLMYAAERGDSDAVKALLAADADVNAVISNDQTPLMIAVWTGNMDVIKALLAADADVNAVDRDDQTALMYTAYHIGGNNEVVKALLTAGANVNAKDRHGRTPLIYAAEQGNNDALKALVDTGADVNLADGIGRTPLRIAAESGDSEAVEALLTAGAQGRNEAAQAARGRGRNEIAKLIENWIIPIKSASKV